MTPQVKAVRQFLLKQHIETIVAIHNNWCDSNHYTELIYPVTSSTIDSFFGSASHLLSAMKEGKFDIKANWFVLIEGGISSNINSKIDLTALANYLIDWGDAGYIFTGDLTEHLQNAFIDEVMKHQTKWKRERVTDLVEESYSDFLMDSWVDILLEITEKY